MKFFRSFFRILCGCTVGVREWIEWIDFWAAFMCKESYSSTWRIIAWLGSVVNNHGDRCCPLRIGLLYTPSKWPNLMAYKWGLLSTYYITGMILQVGDGFNTLSHLFSLPGEMIQFDGSTRHFFSLRGWWKTTKKGWKKTDFAALGGDLFLFLGYSGPCQVGDEVSFTCVTWMKIINRRAIYSLGVLQYIFRWVFLPFQLCNRLKNTGGLTQPGCWFCIYVNAQACYATCCKSQLFFPNSYLPCLVGGFK